MGITIHYRGRLPDLTRVEDFEGRLIDLALEVGGQVQIWRSHAEQEPKRMVRGLILNLAPGQESTSLLLSPEGWLIGLTDIKEAELGHLKEPPWCFTKTQFGSVEGHVALVEMLSALRREFVPDLEVSDEGGYWEARNLTELTQRHSQIQKAIEGLAQGIERHGLSREAAADPAIVLKRIERIAAQVKRVVERPAEHAPVEFPDDESFGAAPGPEATEALWDQMFKHNRRQQERMERALEERLSRGESHETAFDNALSDLGLEIPGEEPEEEPDWDDEQELFTESRDKEAALAEAGGEDSDEQEDPFGPDAERHPLLKDASDLLRDLHVTFREADSRLACSLHTLFQGAGDAVGGLAQALSAHDDDDDIDDYGLRVTQLKRALRGAAFARGALFSLPTVMSGGQLEELRRKLGQLEHGILNELARERSRYQSPES